MMYMLIVLCEFDILTKTQTIIKLFTPNHATIMAEGRSRSACTRKERFFEAVYQIKVNDNGFC